MADSEEKRCACCQNWFPSNELTNGLCLECYNLHPDYWSEWSEK